MADDYQIGDGDISQNDEAPPGNPIEENIEEPGESIEDSTTDDHNAEILQIEQEEPKEGNELLENLTDEQEIGTTLLENEEREEETDAEREIVPEIDEVIEVPEGEEKEGIAESTGTEEKGEEAEEIEEIEFLEGGEKLETEGEEEIMAVEELEGVKESGEEGLEEEAKPVEEEELEGEENYEGEIEEEKVEEKEKPEEESKLEEGEFLEDKEKPEEEEEQIEAELVMKEEEKELEVEGEVTEGTELEIVEQPDEVKIRDEEQLKEAEVGPEKEESKPTEEDKEKAEEEAVLPKKESVITKVGDFIVKKQASFEDITLTPEIELEYSSSSEEEEEEEEEVEEEEEDHIDREGLIDQYKTLQSEARPIVKRNVFLLKKLAEHFKKRKMEHVYRHPEPYSADKELKYHKQLLAFEEIRKTEASQRSMITKELEEMKNQRNVLADKLKEQMDNLIQKERSIGIGLISTRTGKVIPDRVVENLLSRQKRKMKELSEVRLGFIKLRDQVAAKEAQLRALETFGENLHLVDYEQLKIQNQSLADKIEERDEELQSFRNKAKSAMLIMAHMREKSHATDEKMDELCDLLDFTRIEVNNARGYVTDVKKRRDRLRSETLKLRQQAGLLVHPDLLRHFEKSIEEATQLSAEVQNLKNDFYDQKRKLTKIRTDIAKLGGKASLLLQESPPISLPPVTETQKITYMKFTSAARRKSIKVTQSLLNQLCSADSTRRYSKARRASRPTATISVESITKGRPSFFPVVPKLFFGAVRESERLFPTLED